MTMLATEYPLTRAPFRIRKNKDILPDWPVYSDLDELKANVPVYRTKFGRSAWEKMIEKPLAHLRRDDTIPVSRAFYKLREIQESCMLAPSSASVHLCEAPGGFVQATASMAAPGWKFTVCTLGEMRYQNPSGVAHTIDIFDTAPEAVLARGDADFVTADGARDPNHEHLEQDHWSLLVRQTQYALFALAPGGTFVVKFFEGALPSTRMWVARLTCLFGEVSVIKPTSSRATNSERYLLCKNYHGNGTEVRWDEVVVVNEDWMRMLDDVLRRMAKAQADALREVFRKCDGIVKK